jgi:predicted RNase H-like HicB family nuclease
MMEKINSFDGWVLMSIQGSHHVYPAVFTYEDGYEIAVTFPDLPGCATSGEDEADALERAKDALGGHLWCLEKDGSCDYKRNLKRTLL